MSDVDLVELDKIKKRKSATERWAEYQDYLDQADQQTVTPQTNAATNTITAMDTVTKSSHTSKEETSSLKSSLNISRSVSGSGVLSRFWNWLSTPLSTDAKPVDNEIVKGGTTSVGTPGIDAPAEIDKEELAKLKKQLLDEMAEIWNSINSRNEDLNDENNSNLSGAEAVQMFIIKYMIEQRRIREESSKGFIFDISQARARNKQTHSKIIDTQETAADIKNSQATWGKINGVANTANTAVIVGSVALNSLSSYAAAAITGEAFFALMATGITGPIGAAITGISLVAVVASAATKAYKAHLDQKQQVFTGELGKLRGDHDIIALKLREHIGHMVHNYEKSLGLSKEIKQLIDSYQEVCRAVAARQN